MKTLRVKVDLEGLELGTEDKDKSPVEIASLVLKNIIMGYAASKRGLDEGERRKFYKICDALDEAQKTEAEEIQLEDDWMGFLRKCKREATLLPGPLLRRVEDLIDAVEDR